MVKAV
jgi:hypothetical protein